MTTYTAIPNGNVDQDSPITQPLMTLMRDNPIAIAEGAAAAPVVAAGWHPYDLVNVADGADGVIYDFSVDGVVTSIETPDFEDGYEYRLWFVSVTTTTSADTTLEMYRATSAAYDTATVIYTTNGGATTYTGCVEIPKPRLTRKTHAAHIAVPFADDSSGAAPTPGALLVSHGASAEKIGKVRIAAPSFNGGIIYLERRREYLSD